MDSSFWQDVFRIWWRFWRGKNALGNKKFKKVFWAVIKTQDINTGLNNSTQWFVWYEMLYLGILPGKSVLDFFKLLWEIGWLFFFFSLLEKISQAIKVVIAEKERHDLNKATFGNTICFSPLCPVHLLSRWAETRQISLVALTLRLSK